MDYLHEALRMKEIPIRVDNLGLGLEAIIATSTGHRFQAWHSEKRAGNISDRLMESYMEREVKVKVRFIQSSQYYDQSHEEREVKVKVIYSLSHK